MDLSKLRHIHSVDFRGFPGSQVLEGRVQTILLCTLITSACILMIVGLIGFYGFLAIHRTCWRFRHSLILCLICFDYLKALAMFQYNVRIFCLLNRNVPYWPFGQGYLNLTGWLTAWGIEGADVAILTFAVHTYLVIYRPSMTVSVRRSHGTRSEGGLYPFRIYIYVLCICIPTVLSSLAFVNGPGYFAFTAWVYHPPHPKWYTYALSWGPRYAVIIVIFYIYVAIYWHVMREFEDLGGALATTGSEPQPPRSVFLLMVDTFSFAARVVAPHDFHRRHLGDVLLSVAPHRSCDEETIRSLGPLAHPSAAPHPTLGLLEGKLAERRPSEGGSNDLVETPLGSQTKPTHADTPPNPLHEHRPVPVRGASELQRNVRSHNVAAFKVRQTRISRQLRFIFIYPMAYIFIWTLPFLLHVTQMADLDGYMVKKHDSHTFQYWITILALCMQPISCTVDVAVFLFREKPWQFTFARLCEEDYISGLFGTYPREVMMDPNGGFNRAALLETLPLWRRYLIWLPLLGLPLFERALRLREAKLKPSEKDVTASPTGNDFSDLLKGSNDFLKPVPTAQHASFRDFSFRSVVMDRPLTRLNASTMVVGEGRSVLFAHVGGAPSSRRDRMGAYQPLGSKGNDSKRAQTSANGLSPELEIDLGAREAHREINPFSVKNSTTPDVLPASSAHEADPSDNYRRSLSQYPFGDATSVNPRPSLSGSSPRDDSTRDLAGPDNDFLDFLRNGPAV